MFKKILVPTDFSENAKNALETAIDLAKATGASVELLNVVEISAVAKLSEFAEYERGVRELSKEFISNMLRASQRGLNLLKASVTNYGVPISTNVLVDEDPKRLADSILNSDYDLLVIGSQVQSESKGMFGNSTRGRILQLSKHPVLIVNNKVENFELSTIVLATQMKSELSPIMDTIKSLQSLYQADCHLLYVNTPQYFKATHEIKELAHDFINRHQLNGWEANIYSARRIEDGILKFAETIEADLTIVCTDNTNWTFRFFQDDFVNDVAHHSLKPVLIFNMNNVKQEELIGV